MSTTASCFAQVLSLVDRNDFARAVMNHDGERGAKGFSCWDQLVSMLFCQMGGANSLRVGEAFVEQRREAFTSFRHRPIVAPRPGQKVDHVAPLDPAYGGPPRFVGMSLVRM